MLPVLRSTLCGEAELSLVLPFSVIVVSRGPGAWSDWTRRELRHRVGTVTSMSPTCFVTSTNLASLPSGEKDKSLISVATAVSIDISQHHPGGSFYILQS